MPSWNIHIAHAETLLAREGGIAAAVRDRNAFLLGNVVPDIRVGYMVPGIADPLPYRITHFAKPGHIPKPREWEFWDTYIVPAFAGAAPSGIVPGPDEVVERVADDREPISWEELLGAEARADASAGAGTGPDPEHESALAAAVPCPLFPLQEDIERLNRIHYPHRYVGAPPLAEESAGAHACTKADVAQSLRDMLLGIWVHLLADNIWNTRVNEHLDSIGGKPSEEFRIKKQGDFDWFGKTLGIASIVRATDRVVEAAARYPQYSISRDEVLYTAGVVHEVVRENPGDPEHPPYRLLNDEFFSSTFEEVAATAERLFNERMAGCLL